MISLKQTVLVATPIILLATTYLAFRQFVALLGPRLGYLGGFLFYWIVWCILLPWWILGPGRLHDLFRPIDLRLGNPAWLGALFLVIPLLLGYGYAFPRAIGQATTTIILLSALIALVNGTLEEILWRGVYLAAFPDNWFLGYIYPAIGFGVWHLAPQSIFPNSAPGGNWSLVVVAVLVGLLWGWVARQTGSIFWVTISHILFDFSGLGARIYFR